MKYLFFVVFCNLLFGAWGWADEVLAEWVAEKEQVKNGRVEAVHGPWGFEVSEEVRCEDAKAGQPGHFAFRGDGRKKGAVLLEEMRGRMKLPAASMSVEAWVRIHQPLAWGGILSAMQNNGSYERGFVLGFHKEQFFWGVASQCKQTPELTYLASKTVYQPGEWYHVVATYDGKKMNLYVDGELSSSSVDQQGDIAYPETFKFSWVLIGMMIQSTRSMPIYKV